MQAALFTTPGTQLTIAHVAKPLCGAKELLIKVQACGLCRTDLHIFDGDLHPPKLPLILGHEIVGLIEEVGNDVSQFRKGDRVGVSWLGGSCGVCEYCRKGNENLCDQARFTGFHRDGGFAEYVTCLSDVAIHLPVKENSAELTPFLCAGLIGYRSYCKAQAETTLGLYGFGTAAHLLLPLALFEKKKVYVFTRPGDKTGQEEALLLGATWAGDSTTLPPHALDAAILFAAEGALVPQALKGLKKGGRCVCGEIHMSDIPTFPYLDLWGERSICSVANVTRQDALAYFEKLRHLTIAPTIKKYPLSQINKAIYDLKNGAIKGTAVIEMDS
jgi:propanol-preferring alcohol dehydrogenase